MRFRSMLLSLLVIAGLITACSGPATATSTSLHVVPVSSATAVVPRSDRVPRFKHVVIVIEENKSYQDIIGSPYTPYINSLAAQGASFTYAHGEVHPSQPNYLALFSGSTQEKQGVVGDKCLESGQVLKGPDLAGALRMQGYSFGGFSEDLPSPGFTGCPENDDKHAPYVRKHNPWVNFEDVPASVNLPWTMFPKDYSQLPTISFVIPNNTEHNMHSASQPMDERGSEDKDWAEFLGNADNWLETNLGPYVDWAKKNDSLLIVTWDEDSSPQVCKKKTDEVLATRSKLCRSRYSSKVIQLFKDMEHRGTRAEDNIIPTIFVGAGVKAGKYGECITHYDILHTLEVMYGLPLMGETKVSTGAIHEACSDRSASGPITNVWGG